MAELSNPWSVVGLWLADMMGRVNGRRFDKYVFLQGYEGGRRRSFWSQSSIRSWVRQYVCRCRWRQRIPMEPLRGTIAPACADRSGGPPKPGAAYENQPDGAAGEPPGGPSSPDGPPEGPWGRRGVPRGSEHQSCTDTGQSTAPGPWPGPPALTFIDRAWAGPAPQSFHFGDSSGRMVQYNSPGLVQ